MAVDRFYEHASRAGQLADAGLDAAGIAAAVRRTVRAARNSAEGTAQPPTERTPRLRRAP